MGTKGLNFLLFTVFCLIFLPFSGLKVRHSSTEPLANFKMYPNDDLKIYRFKSNSSKVLPGKSTEKGNVYNCSGIILDADKTANLALVSLLYQNGCYTDGRYNHNNFKVEFGEVADSKKENRFDAYRIHEPSKKASQFLASNHCVYYKFPSKRNYDVYELDGEKISKIAEIEASRINVNEYIKLEELTVSSIQGSKVYFFAPSNEKISIYNQYSKNVEGGRVKKTAIGDIYKYRYLVNESLFDPQKENSNPRRYFLMKEKDGIGAVWSNLDNNYVFLSRFGKDLKSVSTVKKPTGNGSILLAACNDDKGNCYYLTIFNETNHGTSQNLTLHKVATNGVITNSYKYDISKSGFNIYRAGSYMTDLKYLNGKLALFIARTMHKSGDGLNHQGGIAVLIDANTLELVKNFGQTSGHSFDNYLATSSKGKFIGIDLGDNYPRGINLHKFDETQIRSRIIYTFKTQHGSTAKSPAGKTYPLYPEISRSGKNYYKWSNDNGTYTSLGALIEVDDGFVVVFTGEPDPSGKSLNSSRAGNKSPDPRNIGFIKVAKNFENSKGKGNVVTDDIVLSNGIKESGGFYTFGGWWSEQRNVGIQWLTAYKNKSTGSAKNLKATKLQNGSILLIWEKYSVQGYSNSYISTYMMKVDANGKKLSAPIEIGSHVRLNRRDDPISVGNNVYILSGNKTEKKLELNIFKLNK